MCEEIAREQQTVRISTDSRRYGKIVTVVEGIDENESTWMIWPKKLKSKSSCRRYGQGRPH
jgi:translation initiation factor 1